MHAASLAFSHDREGDTTLCVESIEQTLLPHGDVGIPRGGYVPIPVTQLLRAWVAYREAIIGLRDLRVWLACQELVARRTAARAGDRVRYRPEEVHTLVGGVGGEHLRSSIRALERANLLCWSETKLAFPTIEPEQLAMDPNWEHLLTLVQNHRRAVPVPRNTLKWLAQSGNRILIATVFAHLLRCVYRRGTTCRMRGTCKASWVAEVFGVDLRNVKRARQHLADIGWLQVVPSHQRRLNASGPVCVVSLDWSPSVTRETPPPPALSTSGLPPPGSDRNLSSRRTHQNPRGRGPTGVQEELHREFRPTLRCIRPEDLRRKGRLLALHKQACERGLASPGVAGTLRFLALAARARRVGTRNACGLLAWLLREGKWDTITLDDEDRARRWLSGAAVKTSTREGHRPPSPPVALATLAASALASLQASPRDISAAET